MIMDEQRLKRYTPWAAKTHTKPRRQVRVNGHRIYYLPEYNVLLSKAVGTVTAEDNALSNKRVKAEMSARPGLKLLVDMSAALVDASPVTFIGMMEAFYREVGNGIRVAVIPADKHSGSRPILATTQAYITGAPLRYFTDQSSALRWLDGTMSDEPEAHSIPLQ